ncbi:hypothetical protein [Aromatoleum buckelii]|uniref:Uncharacterized protein n=1 Tax=Aromatoleum buckelii TaxID=200254 RepID=A0ABX1N7L3_9RHOO|nr:hypothetical protein [Aromatoleum buckelii]MCK0509570.1 hypothetical protein [Aromatoleum buckelii]
MQALLTPVVAITTTYIAYQQYRIQRDERAMVLYDRRLAIFKVAMRVLDRVRVGDSLTTEDVFSWASSVGEAPFLFGNEVQAVLDSMFGVLYEFAVESEPVTRGKPYNSSCAELALDVEALRGPLMKVLSPYLYPSALPPRRKRRLSPKQVERLLSDVASSRAADSRSEQDIPF